MKLHIFSKKKSVFSPHAPHIKIIAVPSIGEFQAGKSSFRFEYCRHRSRHRYIFDFNSVTLTGFCGGGGFGFILKDANHGQAVKYLAREADLRVLNHLHSLGLDDLISAVGKRRARANKQVRR